MKSYFGILSAIVLTLMFSGACLFAQEDGGRADGASVEKKLVAGSVLSKRLEWCRENPGECKARRDNTMYKLENRIEYCREHPEKCEKIRGLLGERKKWCDRNPEKCEAMKNSMNRKMRMRLGMCPDDREKCRQHAVLFEAADECTDCDTRRLVPKDIQRESCGDAEKSCEITES